MYVKQFVWGKNKFVVWVFRLLFFIVFNLL